MHHLTENQRLLLTAYLDAGLAVSSISGKLAISCDRIRREIRRYLQLLKSAGQKPFPDDRSSSRPLPDCERLKKSPHICNGCPLNSRCLRPKMFYDGYHAHQLYTYNLRNCRKKGHMPPEHLQEITQLIINGLMNGQSIHHIIITHADHLNCSEKTIYNYINRMLLPGVNSICINRKKHSF